MHALDLLAQSYQPATSPNILPFYHVYTAFMEAFYLNFMLFSLFQLQPLLSIGSIEGYSM